MLDMGFEPQIREVMQSLRPDHQTMLFSATMPEEIEAMVDDYLKNPVRVKVGNIRPTANVSQHLDKTTDAQKVRVEAISLPSFASLLYTYTPVPRVRSPTRCSQSCYFSCT
jgi:superfamily II DNA/RNA helicase